MLRKILAALLALVLTAAPAALGESGQIAELEARIAELEAENAQLRELLSQEETGRLVAARFDGGIVTVQDAAAAYDSQAYYYEMLGLDPDEYDATIKDEALRSLVEDAILVLKAQELGVYEPSDAEEEEIRRSAQQSLDEMIDYYLPYQADPDLSDEENRAAVEQYLAGEGTTLESLMESQRVQAWRDRLYQAATADFSFSGEDMRAYYEQACATAQMEYTADLQNYESDRINGASVLWNPEGYRRVKRLLIPFSDEDAARMDELTALLEGTTDQDVVGEALTEMDEIYAALDATVEEVLGRVAAGEDFDLLIDEYGADPYMASGVGREEGYYVCTYTTMLDPELVNTAMNLQQPGDVSDPVECADGVYILRYEADVEPGAVDYETFLADEEMRESIAENARREYYNDVVEQWIAEANVEYFPENF